MRHEEEYILVWSNQITQEGKTKWMLTRTNTKENHTKPKSPSNMAADGGA